MTTLTLRPTGDGAKKELTPSSGTNHYALVDESVADDADEVYYYSTSMSSKTDTFTYADCGLGSATINSVTIYARCKRGSSAGAAYTAIKIGETYYNDTFGTLTTSFANYSKAYTTSPATGSAWTVSEIDSAEFGVYIYTVSNGINRGAECSQFYIVIDYTAAAATSRCYVIVV